METIEIRVSEGTATVEATQGESLGVEQIDGAIKSAGFTPRGMTATAVGTVVKRGETSLVRWEGGEAELVDGDQAALAVGQEVRVTGTLTVKRNGTATALVMAVDTVDRVKR